VGSYLFQCRRACLGVMLAAAITGPLLSAGCDEPVGVADDPWRSIRLREFDSAAEAFAASTSPLDRYGKALVDSVCTNTDIDSARRELEALSRQPGEVAAWAALALVRLDHVPPRSDANPDAQKLKAAYAEIISKFPATLVADEAMLYRGALFVREEDPTAFQAGLAELDTYLRERPGTPYESAFHMLRASALRKLGQPREELAALLKAQASREVDPSNPMLTNANDLFGIGVRAQFDVGDFTTARTYYQRLLREYPTDQRVFLVHALMKEMDEVESRLRRELAQEGQS
jgi:tetratricopeptide (TPR) repeat protein